MKRGAPYYSKRLTSTKGLPDLNKANDYLASSL